MKLCLQNSNPYGLTRGLVHVHVLVVGKGYELINYNSFGVSFISISYFHTHVHVGVAEFIMSRTYSSLYGIK